MFSWFLLTVVSAVFLGLYDVAKKSAVRDNAVSPVLFFSVVCGALFWVPWTIWSHLSPETLSIDLLTVQPLSATGHLKLFFKSALVGSSWGFAYVALKQLPLSIASPIRATSPLWTVIIATTFLGERPDMLQWIGVIVILAALYLFSLVGRREGIHFHRDKWVICMFVATILSSFCALYDKYLLQTAGYDASTVQAYFSIYLVVVMLPFYVRWRFGVRAARGFTWRPAIVGIAATLLISDFLYFSAIQQPDALISVISPLRRTSVVIALLAGTQMFGERQFRPKAACIAALMIGVFLISSGAR